MVRASDSSSENLGSMPSNILRVHTEYVLVKSVGGPHAASGLDTPVLHHNNSPTWTGVDPAALDEQGQSSDEDGTSSGVAVAEWSRSRTCGRRYRVAFSKSSAPENPLVD
ncbi:hypothetical protein TNCV_3749521 [Trichonephila clavipes]|nr:hypothetical protein TNCV_3749521 [Trichonephila clavipes]